jgi:hypothetical protein
MVPAIGATAMAPRFRRACTMTRAVRVARAVRRMGELLKQFDGRPDNAVKQKEGTLLLTQEQAAKNAGISEHQRKQAVRVANVTNPHSAGGAARRAAAGRRFFLPRGFLRQRGFPVLTVTVFLLRQRGFAMGRCCAVLPFL